MANTMGGISVDDVADMYTSAVSALRLELISSGYSEIEAVNASNQWIEGVLLPLQIDPMLQ